MKIDNIHELYDQHTLLILQMILSESSTCVDVGANVGDILREMLRLAPNGRHFAFEPLPDLCRQLRSNPEFHSVAISELALSDTAGSAKFYWVKNAPAYSGLRQRRYDRPDPEIVELTVKMSRLDDVIPAGRRVDLIKIDVEGGELPVLRGAKRVLMDSRPFVVFESGKGASDRYGTTGELLFDFLASDCGLEVNTLDGFLTGRPALSRQRLAQIFDTVERYYFVAHRPLTGAERTEFFRWYVIAIDSRLHEIGKTIARIEPAVKAFQAELPNLRVEDWGPRSSNVCEPANVQPDGRSAIWIRASNIQHYGVTYVEFGAHGTSEPATVRIGLITAAIPNEVIMYAGSYPVTVVEPSGRRTTIGTFQVDGSRPTTGV